MISFKTNAIFSMFAIAKYEKCLDYSNDYRSLPRPCHNLAFMLEGEGKIETDDKIITVKKGEIIYIPQGTTYISHWKGSPNIVYHSIHFNFSERCDPLENLDIPIQRLECKNFDSSYKNLKRIHESEKEKNELSFLALSSFFSLCSELISDIKINSKKEHNNPISPALNYLKNNCSAVCTIEALADLCFLSPSRFHYLFKKYTGLSPITYKNELIIRKAAQMLLLDRKKSVEEISEECGFESVIYFRRLFKKITGRTPSEYRKNKTLI